MEPKMKGTKVKTPLVIKLIVIITLIVTISTGLITWLSSYFFMEDSGARAEENNLTLVQVFAARMEAELKEVHSSVLLLLDSLRVAESDVFYKYAEQNFFDRNSSIAYVGVPGSVDSYNEKFFVASELSQDLVKVFLQTKEEEMKGANLGEMFVLNATPYFDFPLACLVAPYNEGGIKNRLVVLFSTEKLQAIVETGSAFTTYALSQSKEVLVHPDLEILKSGISEKSKLLLSRIYSTDQQSIQFTFKDEENVEFFVASQKVDFANFIAVSKVPVAVVYKAVYEIAKRNVILACVVLLTSILGIWFFAQSISRPVRSLVEATKQIEEGKYEINLKPKTKDEIGLLTSSFVNMGQGLAEKERLKETFGKFVNKEVARRAASGELKLGGERRVATIFFSDIRSFTAISENMSPEDVVEFLNAYMTRMVDCIEATHGVVDKFIGDAIMAVWGCPMSQGSPMRDADFAIRATLMMRRSLMEFNKDRGTPDKPILRIGCGINTGNVLAGQIGSSKRMEYTVIGDAVNTASRIEALNKPFGTDILISENTYKLLKERIIVEPMQPIKVKGKVAPLQIYAVINYKDAEGPQTLAEVREMVGIPVPKGEVSTEEEVKYEILEKK